MLFFAFVVCRLVLGYFALFVSDLSHSEWNCTPFTFWIPDSVRKVLKNSEIFSQPAGPVGKPNQPVHWVPFARIAVWVLCFICVGSWSFGDRIALRLFFLDSWIFEEGFDKF